MISGLSFGNLQPPLSSALFHTPKTSLFFDSKAKVDELVGSPRTLIVAKRRRLTAQKCNWPIFLAPALFSGLDKIMGSVYNIYIMKLKVGDKVRVIGKGPCCQDYYHKVSTIYEIHHGDPHPYQLSIPGKWPIFHAKELEKVE